MSAIIQLGVFERVSVRNAWPTEHQNFTPWLAESANIVLLGDALDLELEVEAVEHGVGAFRADILARAIDETEHRVVIENQFGRTDHSHLGQLLTYLAGVEQVKTVVWIAETIQADHRAAIDWLNANTLDPFSFFAIEIELWRIGGSPPAAKFNVIASPNDWTKRARNVGRDPDNGILAERHQVRIAYWASFSEYLKSRNSHFKIRRSNKDHWFEFPIGRSGTAITASISTDKKRLGVELYNHRDSDKAIYRALLGDRHAIESEFGQALDWQELVGKKASRIAIYRLSSNPADVSEYDILHSWMLEQMNRFRDVFGNRVRALPASISEAPLAFMDSLEPTFEAEPEP